MNINKTQYGANQMKNFADSNNKINKPNSVNFKAMVEKNLNKTSEANVSKPERVDKIEISSQTPFDVSALRTKIVAQINAPTNPARVESVKQQVEQGTYKVDAYEIAKKMLNL